MPLKSYPHDILEQATDILAACKQIDPELRAGQTTQAQIKALEMQLTELRNRRDDQLGTLWEAAKRWRAAVKSIYGDDSSQYELMGGTRLSDRKRMTRRTTQE